MQDPDDQTPGSTEDSQGQQQMIDAYIAANQQLVGANEGPGPPWTGAAGSLSLLAPSLSLANPPSVITCGPTSSHVAGQLSLLGTPTVIQAGGTVHYHGPSPVQGGLPPLVTSQSTSGQTTIPSSNQRTSAITPTFSTAASSAQIHRSLFESCKHLNPAGFSASPRKRRKLDIHPAASHEIAMLRKDLCEYKLLDLKGIKESYVDHLTELFFLQNGNNLMEYHFWRKRPTPQLTQFLTSGNLDSDDDDDRGLERWINDEVKVVTSSGSNVPMTTPVATSTTLPASVSALSKQGSDVKKPGGRHGMVFGHHPVQLPSHIPVAVPATTTPAAMPAVPVTTVQTPSTVTTTSIVTSTPTTLPTTTSITTSSMVDHIHSQLMSKLAHSSSSAIKTALGASLSPGMKSQRSPPLSPGQRFNTRQQSISAVYDSTIGSQEAIVERAKQEAQVMQRVAELRREGLWTSRRLPKVYEPPRNKAHWDYLLEEMTWLAADFAQERKWKKAAARKVARMVTKHFQEMELKEVRAEKEESQKLKRIATQIAKQVKEFWSNIEKVVEYKQQSRLEEKRKKALDVHLNFIVDQTEKYSSWLTEGLARPPTGSAAPSVKSDSTLDQSVTNEDDDFEPEPSDSDDEETIDKEEQEAEMSEEDVLDEIEALKQESELPLEDLINTLPTVTANDDPAGQVSVKDLQGDVIQEQDHKDEEYVASEDEEIDVEETIDEQEKHERKGDTKREVDDLEAEGNLSIEELRLKYAGAYDSDFEFDDATEDEPSEDEESDEEDEEETEEDEDEDDEEEEVDDRADVGLEYLMHPEKEGETPDGKQEDGTKSPGKEITDIAAEALSLQPKGYTLQTTEVQTPIPFLLKHKLREYQHVGLDWLATMHDKRLNGILADEMGLGKTIQTIALLAHLVCEKSIWGPHLIVVPTSVMLNWEMEFKKWCPAFKILTYYGTQKERKLKRQGWTKTNAFHVCITSYKLVIQDHQSFRRKKWKYFILDEAQNIKNFKSQRWQTLLNFQSQRRLLLTGTPLQNSLMELWSLMHFLMPNVFQSHREFKEWFANPLTGMIEGSHEYNEGLIRRLHKVLRPFLLRRLKCDVEKQMPKKYEHVVKCYLSKRQRYLYDEFMSQTKTKETLATGHFMSVINILMQLRKVCNHPNLFDLRPIVSAFQTEGIVFYTASRVLRALQYDPFQHVDIRTFFPSLAEMELDLPAFIAHRIKKLQASKRLIMEIDSQPDPPPRPRPVKLKTVIVRSASPFTQVGRSSPLTIGGGQPRPASPLTIIRPPTVRSPIPIIISQQSQGPLAGVMPLKIGIVPQLPPSQLHAIVVSSAHQQLIAMPGVQAKVLQTTTSHLSAVGSTLMSSHPITVQIQQTDQGTRLMIPTGQLSQLPGGFIQIVQTASGQQMIAASSQSPPVQPVIPIQNSVATTQILTRPPTMALSSPAPQLSSIQMTMVTTSQPKTSPAVLLPSTTKFVTNVKPVMRVSPLATDPSVILPTATLPTSALYHMATSAVPVAMPVTLSLSSRMVDITKPTFSVVKPTVATTIIQPPPIVIPVTTSSIPATASVQTTVKEPEPTTMRKVAPKKKSEFYMESLQQKLSAQRKEKLELLAKLNQKHCDKKPVYGQDLCRAVDVSTDLTESKLDGGSWNRLGFVSCWCSHNCPKPCHPDYYWRQTEHLRKIVHTPEDYLDELRDVVNRYAFVTPPVSSPTITMRTSHPPPSLIHAEKLQNFLLRRELTPKMACLHKIAANMTVQFPELRLIQYDCGKLQTLDLLLRRLKSGDHRVLIFTQMTKMLDIFEAFLNYHGHRYVRLDGTTKVDQRQLLMDRFNADKRIFVFILSTRSGGIGVNLTGADTVIFYDSDWNPTMDAQAQDRCHRIGQTRDVHIYRLISEKTIEENILKKANQKRLLGDVAIEGGSFTTAFFKQETIHDLFEEPTGMEVTTSEEKTPARDSPAPGARSGEYIAQFEQALCKAEDETDVLAADQLRAEQKAELAEFDENIPWDEKEADKKKDDEDVSKVEMELALLEKELSPVERYAMTFMEASMDPCDESENYEEDVEISKNNWELARLKALKEEEELRAEFEEDEMLYTYARDDNQVKKKTKSTRKSSGEKQPSRKTRRSGGGLENEGHKAGAQGGINGGTNSGIEKAKSPCRTNSVVVDGVTRSPPLRSSVGKTRASSPIKSPTISPTRAASLLSPRKTEASDGSKNASKTSPLSVAIPKIRVAKATVQSPLANNHVGLRTRKLSSPNSAQSSTKSAPSSTKSAPSSTESAPISTESAPISTESAPSSTKSAPSSTKSAPSSTNVSPKEKTKPPVLQPWSKPHLVIRTRRASLQQTKETNEVAIKLPISPNLPTGRLTISPNPVVSRVPILPNPTTNAESMPNSTTELPKAEATPSPTTRLPKAEATPSPTTRLPKAEAMPSPTTRLTKAQIISSLKAAIAGHRRSMSAKEGSKNVENDICNAR